MPSVKTASRKDIDMTNDIDRQIVYNGWTLAEAFLG